MILFILGAILFTLGMCLIAMWGKPTKVAMLNPQVRMAEEADKAKRTPARLTAAIVLILLGLGLAVSGIFSSPGTGQCNYEGQCQQYTGIPFSP